MNATRRIYGGVLPLMEKGREDGQNDSVICNHGI